jgi:putative flippase GtrA
MCRSRPACSLVNMRTETFWQPAGRRLTRRQRFAAWSVAVRFAIVGCSGYAVNLATFALILHLTAAGYRLAGAGAFLTAVVNNYLWNRHWTFRAGDGPRGRQAARFFTVSLAALGLTLLLLTVLISSAGIANLLGEALATVAMTPLAYLANRRWTFAPQHAATSTS